MRVASEIDGVSEINRWELNSYQLISCIESETKRALATWTTLRKTQLLELTQPDNSRKIGISSMRTAKYFVVFLDNSTEMIAVYFLKEKSEILNAITPYKATVENQKKFKVQLLIFDKTGEQIGKFLRIMLKKKEYP